MINDSATRTLFFPVLCALLIDIAFGELPNRFHPVYLMGNWIRLYADQARKLIGKNAPLRQFLFGLAGILLGMALFALPLALIQGYLDRLDWIPRGILSGFLLKQTFSIKGLLRAAEEIASALNARDLNEARRLTSWHLVSRDTSALSERQIASATIESIAENITDSFITPVICFFLGGLPLAWVFRLVNTADAMIGYHGEPWEYIGKAPARLDDLINLIPARFAALLICLSAPIAGGYLRGAFSRATQEHSRALSPNAGWTIGAAAGALNVHLEKIGCYSFCPNGREPTASDITRAKRLIICAIALFLLVCPLFMQK